MGGSECCSVQYWQWCVEAVLLSGSGRSSIQQSFNSCWPAAGAVYATLAPLLVLSCHSQSSSQNVCCADGFHALSCILRWCVWQPLLLLT